MSATDSLRRWAADVYIWAIDAVLAVGVRLVDGARRRGADGKPTALEASLDADLRASLLVTRVHVPRIDTLRPEHEREAYARGLGTLNALMTERLDVLVEQGHGGTLYTFTVDPKNAARQEA